MRRAAKFLLLVVACDVPHRRSHLPNPPDRTWKDSIALLGLPSVLLGAFCFLAWQVFRRSKRRIHWSVMVGAPIAAVPLWALLDAAIAGYCDRHRVGMFHSWAQMHGSFVFLIPLYGVIVIALLLGALPFSPRRDEPAASPGP